MRCIKLRISVKETAGIIPLCFFSDYYTTNGCQAVVNIKTPGIMHRVN